MSKANFTPGPWSVTRNCVDTIEVVFGGGSYFRGDAYLNIQPVSSLSNFECIHSGGTAEANAHLIAAAPDMYDMLRSLSEMSPEDAKLFLENTSDITDLLTKARGEQ